MELTRKQTEALDYLEDGKTIEVPFRRRSRRRQVGVGVLLAAQMCVEIPGQPVFDGAAGGGDPAADYAQYLAAGGALQGLPDSWLRVNDQRGEVAVAYGRFGDPDAALAGEAFDPEFDELGSLEITGAFIDECNQVSLRAWMWCVRGSGTVWGSTDWYPKCWVHATRRKASCIRAFTSLSGMGPWSRTSVLWSRCCATIRLFPRTMPRACGA